VRFNFWAELRKVRCNTYQRTGFRLELKFKAQNLSRLKVGLGF